MKNSIKIFVLGLISSLLLTINPAMGQTAEKIAVFPFEVYAQDDLSFLQKGLYTMLATRLADPGKVEILAKEEIDNAIESAQSSAQSGAGLNEATVRIIATRLHVDYAVFGSLTMFGESMSLDTMVIDINGVKPTLKISRQAKKPGAVITELDQIATEINLKIFDRKPENFITESQVYQRPAPVQFDGQPGVLTNYRTLLSLDGEVIGISSGDVDGDKSNEVVVVYRHAIEIFKRLNDRQLRPLLKIKDAHYLDIVAVDVADINTNGVDEIFITRIHPESGKIKSMVLEFNGSKYDPIADDLPWYLRLVKDDKNTALYAQPGDANSGPYHGRVINRVAWDNSGYKLAEPMMVPNGFSIMGFAMTSIGDTTGSDSLFTDKTGRLVVFNQNGKIEWSSDDGFGGTRIYYTYSKDSKALDEIYRDESDGKGVYLQPRNLITDLDQDGEKEAIVIKNGDSAGYFFNKMRRFKSGSIEIKTVNELGLISKGLPKTLPGQITDIFINDLNDGTKKELMITLIKKRNSFSSKKSKSMIIAFDI